MDAAPAGVALPGFDIGATSHALAALAFLPLALLLLRRWVGRQHARSLGLACLMTALWGGANALLAGASGPLPALLETLFETLRAGAWIVFLLRLLETAGPRRKAFFSVLGLAGALQLGALALAEPAAQGATSLVRLLQAVLGMLLVEQLYRNTPAQQRWGIKFACFGIGALFAYDFFLYSDALLLRQTNPDIAAARGIVTALSAPLLVLSAARNPAWNMGLAVSRHVMLRSAALLGSAIYLLAMALSAWFLRYLGGAWGPVMQLAYLGGAVLLLAAALFSGTLRARLKVMINKHFYRGQFDYRQEWLRFTRALSEAGPGLAERSVQALAALVDSPAGALWLRRHGPGGDRFEPAASWNTAAQDTVEPAGAPFCRFLEARQWVVEIDAWLVAPPESGVTLPSWLREARLPAPWLLVPLMLHGRLFGFVTLARPRARIELNWEVTDLLKIAGSQAASYLAHRESADSLVVARQFDAFNRMSIFVVHDLKNLVFQLSLLLSNAARHKANPAFQEDMLATLEHSVRKMTMLLQKLGREPAPDDAAPLSLERLLSQLVAARAAAEPAPSLKLDGGGLTVLADRTRLERVLGHLLQNAIEACPRDGTVVLHLQREHQHAVIELRDSGHGMSAQFIRERLFKPFDTTKAAGMGIGVFESREYIVELGGRLEVSSVAGAGTTFRVLLPLHADDTPPLVEREPLVHDHGLLRTGS